MNDSNETVKAPEEASEAKKFNNENVALAADDAVAKVETEDTDGNEGAVSERGQALQGEASEDTGTEHDSHSEGDPGEDPDAENEETAEAVPEPDIQDLYSDYSDRLEGIEENRYFRYLFELIRAGENKFYQSNQIMHKVVDESWLTTIENSLDALNRIINKPRKFITTVESVVPVGLAKKITADSIKHLSKNTQFIVSEPGEPVQPTKILNSSMEETYDLYENRFIYHLIQRLVRFIDKRTDVIFWATGDETRNRMTFESQVDDAYEQISYKIEMTVKNLQSYAENDADNMEVFARIDRVRRLVTSIKSSSFCSIMRGCTLVRSPIQRTNLMIKDPDYRTCYRLWHFLENYDEVGYTIDVIDNTMAFDDEYVSRMYTNMISEYTAFKSIIDGDDRVLGDELRKNLELAQSKKEIRPRFIKEIREEAVDNRDLPDVEIKRVFVEEVTEAQLAAEARAEQAEKDMLAAREAQNEAEKQMRDAQHREEEAEDRAGEAMKKLDFMSERAEKFRILANNAEKAQRETEERSAAEIEAARAHAEETVKKALSDAEKQIADKEAEARADMAKTRSEAEASIAGIREKADRQIAEAQEARNIAEDKAQRNRRARETAESELNAAKRSTSEAESRLAEAENRLKKAEKRLDVAEQLKNTAENRAQQKVYAVQGEMSRLKEKYDAAVISNYDLRKQLDVALAAAAEAEKKLEKERREHELELEKARSRKGGVFGRLLNK